MSKLLFIYTILFWLRLIYSLAKESSSLSLPTSSSAGNQFILSSESSFSIIISSPFLLTEGSDTELSSSSFKSSIWWCSFWFTAILELIDFLAFLLALF